MYKDKILNIISQGENSAVEFKEKDVKKESIAKEFVALSNSYGGVLLIGVADNGDILGINSNFNYEEWIMNIARHNVIPAIRPSYKKVVFDEKEVIIIDIPKGNNKPYQTLNNKYLIRIGSTNRVATQDELMRLYQQSGFFHYDLNCVDNTSIVDLNLTQIDKYFQRYDVDFLSESENEKILLLRNTDILTNENQCTVAGLLIFGINPQRRLINASISVARFKGNEINSELLDKKIIDGTIDTQVDTTVALINNLIPEASSIKGTKRVSLSNNFKIIVFRELVVNAIVHRNYSILGSQIRIFIFDNRIEFKSPGRLPNTISIEKIRKGVSYAINPVILKFMENLRYIDKLGRGIPMVCKEVAKINKRVEFEEQGEEFCVTLFL